MYVCMYVCIYMVFPAHRFRYLTEQQEESMENDKVTSAFVSLARNNRAEIDFLRLSFMHPWFVLFLDVSDTSFMVAVTMYKQKDSEIRRISRAKWNIFNFFMYVERNYPNENSESR